MKDYTMSKYIVNCLSYWWEKWMPEFIEDLIICYVPSLLILGIVIWALN